MSGAGELQQLARWATDAEVPAGRIAVSGTVSGPTTSPQTAIRVRSDALSWRGLRAIGLDGDLAMDAGQLAVAPGRPAGRRHGPRSGEFIFTSGDSLLDLSWDRLEAVGVLARALASPAGLQPSARATGSASVRGHGTDLAGWSVAARAVLAADVTARNRLGVGGSLAARVENGDWQLVADVTAGSLPLAARVGGRVNTAAPLASTLGGTLASNDADLQALART